MVVHWGLPIMILTPHPPTPVSHLLARPPHPTPSCLSSLTQRWWHDSAPGLPYPRSGPLSSSHPPGCFWWQTPPQWCFCSPGWIHSVWNGIRGYSSPRRSLRSAPLPGQEKTTLHQYTFIHHLEMRGRQAGREGGRAKGTIGTQKDGVVKRKPSNCRWMSCFSAPYYHFQWYLFYSTSPLGHPKFPSVKLNY